LTGFDVISAFGSFVEQRFKAPVEMSLTGSASPETTPSMTAASLRTRSVKKASAFG